MDPNDPNYFFSSQSYPSQQDYPFSQNYSNYQNSQQFPNVDYQNFSYSPNLNNPHSSEDVESMNTKMPKGSKTSWCVKEDVALMSSWIYVSEDKVRGKNQKGGSLWGRVHKLYHDRQAENPNELNERNVESMKGRWKRLSENVNRWVGAYKEAYARRRSGMSETDIEKEAQTIYEEGGTRGKFQDFVVFKEVMSKHPKWDITSLRCENEEDNDEDDGRSHKRSKTSEDGGYSVPSGEETPSSGASISRPMGRDKAKRKGKGKVSTSNSSNEFVAELRAMRISKDNELEFMKNAVATKKEMDKMKMYNKTLNTLLAKHVLTPEEEDLKIRLMTLVFGPSN